ncbi:MAG: hypothetical protein ACLQFR_22300 [Streptosporangiaceae bacterium]
MTRRPVLPVPDLGHREVSAGDPHDGIPVMRIPDRQTSGIDGTAVVADEHQGKIRITDAACQGRPQRFRIG